MTRRATSHTGGKHSLRRRLTLRRTDGRVYLNRWGIADEKIGRVLLHRMDAPDPGIDLHDHPWPFVSIILWGGYTEERAETRAAPRLARFAEYNEKVTQEHVPRGDVAHRRWLSARVMRLDECHTITHLDKRVVWTLVIGGRRRREWGFYLPEGYVPEGVYDRTVRAERRDLWSDQHSPARPW